MVSAVKETLPLLSPRATIEPPIAVVAAQASASCPMQRAAMMRTLLALAVCSCPMGSFAQRILPYIVV